MAGCGRQYQQAPVVWGWTWDHHEFRVHQWSCGDVFVVHQSNDAKREQLSVHSGGRWYFRNDSMLIAAAHAVAEDWSYRQVDVQDRKGESSGGPHRGSSGGGFVSRRF